MQIDYDNIEGGTAANFTLLASNPLDCVADTRAIAAMELASQPVPLNAGDLRPMDCNFALAPHVISRTRAWRIGYRVTSTSTLIGGVDHLCYRHSKLRRTALHSLS